MRQLFPVFVIFGLASTLTAVVGHQCYNGCNGHGYCINSQSSCNCFNGWQGPDCRERVCPTGYAWGGEPTGTDAIRSAEVECSNAGYCDRTTGVCTCDTAYTGFACERLKCPSLCSGHGICTSLKTAATTKKWSEPGSLPYDLYSVGRGTFVRLRMRPRVLWIRLLVEGMSGWHRPKAERCSI